jgi:hypothetical protein
MTRTLTLTLLLAVAGCNSNSPAPSPTPSAAASTPAPAAAPTASSATPSSVVPADTPTPESTHDVAVLENRDCRAVGQAYVDALARNDFDFAARVWNDPAINAAKLRAVFTAYNIPHVVIAKVQEEGAAGSLYCTITARLTDNADPNKTPQTGEIVLRRVNDVPGATADQLRWTIQSSTLVEKLQRTAK